MPMTPKKATWTTTTTTSTMPETKTKVLPLETRFEFIRKIAYLDPSHYWYCVIFCTTAIVIICIICRAATFSSTTYGDTCGDSCVKKLAALEIEDVCVILKAYLGKSGCSTAHGD
ncbi:hypothetical protein BJY04DRAFT_202673 [Aspergillus karnatakaensis]|uniref:uncharacterized protein n=1 Tax=Aspergillus karnatakaensis TaxID=1810916 RepID=UPI003CCE0E06